MPASVRTELQAPDLLAAKAALIALRATLRRPVSLDQFLIHPSRQLRTLDEAATDLSGAPKPLICTAKIWNGSIAVRCESAQQHRDSLNPDIEMGINARRIRRILGIPSVATGAELIEFRGEDAFVLVSPEIVDIWNRDYTLPEVARSFSKPDDTARRRGAIGLLKVSWADETLASSFHE